MTSTSRADVDSNMRTHFQVFPNYPSPGRLCFPESLSFHAQLRGRDRAFPLPGCHCFHPSIVWILNYHLARAALSSSVVDTS